VRKAAFVGAVLLLAMFTAGTVSMSGSEPGGACNKQCGRNGQAGFGTRNSSDCTDCTWVACDHHVEGDCGYSDNFNDNCTHPIWCD
jgi:hypothetical protein